MRVGTPGFIGERLTEARLGRGIKQVELANMLGLTRQTVSLYESENSDVTPSPEAFSQLISILRLPPHFFTLNYEDSFEGKTFFYRSKSSTSGVDRDRVETRLRWSERLVAYVNDYVDFPELNLPESILNRVPDKANKITDELISELARDIRYHWGLGEKPIPHLTRLLESNGIFVILDDFDADEVDGLSAWTKYGVPFIMLNRDNHSAPRNRMNAAHEFGELVVHFKLGKADPTNKKLKKLLEEQAFRFACELLLPPKAFLSDLYSLSLDSLSQLKLKWKVAISAMLVHLHRLGKIDDNQHRSFQTKLTRRGWRNPEPYDDRWSLEEPVMLKQAFEIIVEESYQSPYDILHHTALDRLTVSELASLPDDFFDKDNLDGKLIRLKPRKDEEENEKSTSRTLSVL